MRRRRLETHPLRTAAQRRRLARAAGLSAPDRALLEAVDPRIAPGDEMYVGHGGHYFSVGLSAIQCVRAALAAAGAGTPRRLLDMPCGHGRVLRFLVSEFPGASAVACDLNEGGMAFCAERFGAQAVRSSADLSAVSLPGPFDLIWCGSLLTHLDARRSAGLLALFSRSLAPGGVAVVSTHGELVAQRLRSGESTYQLSPGAALDVARQHDESGFGYADYPWSPGYGVSACSRQWLAAAATAAGLRELHFDERGWDDHQDVFALGAA
jgi:SAM-dependent methyltransferase